MSRPANRFPVVLALLLASCTSAPPVVEVAEVPGECGDVFGGTVCTFAEMQGDALVSVGATVPLATIEGAPAEMEMLWPPVPNGMLLLPAAAQQASGMSHLTVVWEAHGHPPGPFLTPHFDFHFYGISPEQREAIDCLDLTKPAALPAGYELPDAEVEGLGLLVGLCVPKMGMHGLLGTEMTATGLFDATMVLGYNAGEPIFTEPMISREFLLKKQGFTLPVPALTHSGATRYPTAFQATWDEAGQAYRFVFSGFPIAAN